MRCLVSEVYIARNLGYLSTSHVGLTVTLFKLIE